MAAKILAMFPGQGSQFVGMGKTLLDEFPASRLTFEEAEDATKIAIRKLCFEGPESELKLTANTQPCILTVSVAIWRVLRAETGFEPAIFAGHSLGEYSALVAADKLSLSRAAFLVRRRGEAMQRAVPEGLGAMAAVLNCPADDLKARCEATSKDGRVVEVVNFNSPGQLVVAGHKEAVDKLGVDLAAAQIRFVALPVSAPFHSKLMEPARRDMTPLLEESTITKNDHRIIANLTGEVVVDYDASYLIQQIDSPVLWTQSMETAAKEGAEVYLEVGPGKVLVGLARRILPRGTGTLLATEDVKETVKALGGLA